MHELLLIYFSSEAENVLSKYVLLQFRLMQRKKRSKKKEQKKKKERKKDRKSKKRLKRKTKKENKKIGMQKDRKEMFNRDTVKCNHL